ncbi:MAG: DUF481 domain-containing protein [Bacteroidia bacterium]|jgi:hypothetical protein|nr:DUF481 domain-containing protein [Bacteroidia bacterium]
MNKISAVYLAFLIWVSIQPVLAQDTLYLNNGSVLIGKIKNMDLGTVSFDIKNAGVVTIELEKIKTFHIESKLIKVETMFKQSMVGYVHSHPDTGMVWMVTYTDSIALFLSTIVSAVPFDKSLWTGINTTVGGGYSYTRSSDVGRLNFDGKVNYTLQKLAASFTASFIVTQEKGRFIRDRENINLLGNYFYTNMWFNQLSINYQRNIQLGLVRRLQQGVLLGNRFFSNKHMQAKFLSGIAVNQEVNTEGNSSGALSEIPVALTYNFYRYEKPKFILSVSEVAYFGVNQNGRIRQDGDFKLTWKFWDDLSINMSIYHNYDSRPPSAGKSNLDYGVVFSVGYEF